MRRAQPALAHRLSRGPLSVARGFLLLLGALIWSLAAPGSASADVLPLRIQVYCPTASQPCNFPDEATLRTNLLQKIGEVNLEFLPSEIAFRPDPILFTYGSKYNDLEGPGGPQNLIDELRAQADGMDTITLFLIPGLSKCWSTYPLKGERGVFCGPEAPGSVFAHELGHFLCQWHTFTDQVPKGDFPDPATHRVVDHDGDDLDSTPDDPGKLEGFKASKPENVLYYDEDSLGAPRPNRHWCRAKPALQAGLPGVDAGSPHGSYCVPECWQTNSDSMLLALDESPFTSNAMSYYGGACRGPYVVRGKRTEAFTEEQMDSMLFCRNTALSYLPEACPGGDSDGDGWCDDEDNCPNVMNTAQSLPACDKDGDGCPDAADLNPLSAYQEAGTVLAIGCSPETGPWYAWEGSNPDGDRLLSCRDDDDDNDNIPDISDPCPTVPWQGGTLTTQWQELHAADCHKVKSCPFENWWDTCLVGGGCNELAVRIDSVINPDPIEALLFDDVVVAGDEIFLGVSGGATVSEMLRAIAPASYDIAVAGLQAASAPAPGRAGRALRTGNLLSLDLVSKATGQVVVRAAEFDPAQVIVGEPELGRLVRIRPGSAGGPLEIAGSWGTGASGVPPADGDGDAVPDLHDNCPTLANRSQRDRDLDGRGDVCDGDLDNDGDIDGDDLDRIEACLGTDLSPLGRRGVELEAGTRQGRLDESRELLRLEICEPADLDGDGDVDGDDLTRARMLSR